MHEGNADHVLTPHQTAFCSTAWIVVPVGSWQLGWAGVPHMYHILLPGWVGCAGWCVRLSAYNPDVIALPCIAAAPAK